MVTELRASAHWIAANRTGLHRHDYLESKISNRKIPPTSFLRFAANGFPPLAFQFLETTPWMMPKPINDLESALRFKKARVLAIKLGLVKLLKTFQHLFA